MAEAQTLKQELQTYASHLADLSNQAGKYVLIQDGSVEGTFDTYEDALKVGYSKFKLLPFLVKQISPAERILSFSRDLQFASDNAQRRA
jgi:hypothetical protein